MGNPKETIDRSTCSKRERSHSKDFQLVRLLSARLEQHLAVDKQRTNQVSCQPTGHWTRPAKAPSTGLPLHLWSFGEDSTCTVSFTPDAEKSSMSRIFWESREDWRMPKRLLMMASAGSSPSSYGPDSQPHSSLGKDCGVDFIITRRSHRA